MEFKILVILLTSTLTEESYKKIFSLNKKYFSKDMHKQMLILKEAHKEQRKLDMELLDEKFITKHENNFRDNLDSSLVVDLDYYIAELKVCYRNKLMEMAARETNLDTVIEYMDMVKADIQENNSDNQVNNIGSSIVNFLNNQDNKRYNKPLTTGYEKFDKFYQMNRGDLVVVGARPSMGKTAFILNLFHGLTDKHKGILFNLEMTEYSVVNRLMAIATMIPANKIRNEFDNLSDSEMMTISVEQNNLFRKSENMHIKSSSVSINDIESCIVTQKEKLDFIIIDYLQIIRGSKGQSRYELVTELSIELKRIALKYNIVVIVLSQLSREIEKRADRQPVMSDLRESGQLEQDASIIVGLYRENYYKPDGEKVYFGGFEDIKLVGMKNREGEIVDTLFSFNAPTQKVIQK
ncbi:MAG: DnaB-like helicase C-terminal domain-containing protein [Fusobacteriaceae bacterium]